MMALTGSNLAPDNVNYFYCPNTKQLRTVVINHESVQLQGKKDEILITIPNLQDQIRNLNLQLFQENIQELQNRVEYFELLDFDPFTFWKNEYQKYKSYFDRISKVKEKCKNITDIITSDLELILSFIYNQTEQQYVQDLEKLLQIIQIHKPEKLKLVGQFKPWMSGFGMIQFPQGHRIIGEIRFAHLCGRGVLITSRNVILKGTFQNNKLQGQGTVIRPEGNQIDGIFYDSELQSGKIKFTHTNGKIIEATLTKEELNKRISFSDFKLYQNDEKQTILEVKKLEDKPSVYCLRQNNQIISKVDEDGTFQGWVFNLKKNNKFLKGVFNTDENFNFRGTIRHLSGELYFKIQSCVFEDGLISGSGTKYYQKSGQIHESGFFNKDQLQGEGIRYYDGQNAQIKECGIFNLGKLNGEGKKYYQNGQIMEQGMFQNNILEGQGVKFHQNGKIMQRGFFHNGALQGEGEKRYENGACEEYGIFENGLLHSLEFQSAKAYPNEQYNEVGYFQNGLLTGQGTIYYNNGNKREEGEFNKGDLITGTKYYNNGQKKEEGSFQDNMLHCQAGKQYYEDGKMKSQGSYENGQLQGKGIQYYQQYEIRGVFRNGVVSGNATLFNHSQTGLNQFSGVFQSTQSLLQASGKDFFQLSHNPFG